MVSGSTANTHTDSEPPERRKQQGGSPSTGKPDQGNSMLTTYDTPIITTVNPLAAWERSTAYRLLCQWRAAGCPAYVSTDPDEIAAIQAACGCGNETQFCTCEPEGSDDE